MREETRKTLCEIVIEGEDAALLELVSAAEEKRHTDFWTIATNMSRLLDLDRRLGCSEAPPESKAVSHPQKK